MLNSPLLCKVKALQLFVARYHRDVEKKFLIIIFIVQNWKSIFSGDQTKMTKSVLSAKSRCGIMVYWPNMVKYGVKGTRFQKKYIVTNALNQWKSAPVFSDGRRRKTECFVPDLREKNSPKRPQKLKKK